MEVKTTCGESPGAGPFRAAAGEKAPGSGAYRCSYCGFSRRMECGQVAPACPSCGTEGIVWLAG